MDSQGSSELIETHGHSWGLDKVTGSSWSLIGIHQGPKVIPVNSLGLHRGSRHFLVTNQDSSGLIEGLTTFGSLIGTHQGATLLLLLLASFESFLDS